MGILTIFGLVTGTLAIISFRQNNIPAECGQDNTTYRFAVGLDRAGGLNQAGGDLPDIHVWNEIGESIGSKYDAGRVENGQFQDVAVKLTKRSQPSYTLLTGNNDGICIAYISQKWGDGGSYGWIGNWADEWACKRSWYYANVWLDNRLLNCAWLDRNGNTPVTAIQLHLPEFVQSPANQGKNKEYFCRQGPAMRFYYDHAPHNIEYWVPSRKRNVALGDGETAIAEGPVKPGGQFGPRQTAPAYNETRLVWSPHEDHSAIKLCESEFSAGPDLVSLHEGKFCDMSTREVFPLCTGAITSDCFDTESKTIRFSESTFRTHGEVESKEYSAVLDWSS